MGGDQRGDELRFALAEQRRQDEREEDRRKGELQVDDPHDHARGPAATISREQPEARPDAEREHAGREPHLDRDAQAVEDRGEEVAPLRVGAEPVRVALGPDEARRPTRVRQAEIGDVVGVLRRDPGR